jgi:3-deoxy-D-manno-octulosonate 8-phosphate phosphatase (KDO 8-P phosphatase)
MSTASSDASERGNRAALERASRVRLMLFDVDGVLTDGRLWYGASGEALKAFSAFDGHGVKLLLQSGTTVGLLSGRSSPAVTLRAAELGIAHVLQGIDDKLAAFDSLLAKLGVPAAETGFMGDDLIDLPVLRRCGFACAPREAPDLVRSHAHYVAHAPAGRGAAREICEFLMGAQGKLQGALDRYLA